MIEIRHALNQRKDDLYETPPEATRALLKHEKLPHKIWEPACGRGAIAGVLIESGHAVYPSDLVDHGYGFSGRDFLMEFLKPDCECVVTNPPFKLANEFVRKALDLCPKVVMLLRLAYLESEGRSDILDGGRLARVYVFKNRLPMMHRDGWEGPRATSTTAFAWFVWDGYDNKAATLHRISWEK